MNINNNKSFGIPYMGSKNKIAEWVVSHLPRAEHFYDLFAGGCAISHCAILSRKWKKVHVNDINPVMPSLFIDAINGKFKDETRWIGHDEFFRLRRTGDAYVDICFSFGSRYGNTYAYSKDLEPIKKAIHNAVFFRDYSLMHTISDIDLSELDGIDCYYDRYMWLRKTFSAKGSIPTELMRVQSIERLNRINRMSEMDKEWVHDILDVTSVSYDEVDIKPNSVIYADIPYRNTGTYDRQKFDHERFYDWASRQTQPLFISEYHMPEDRFVCIAEKNKRCCMAANSNSQMSVERIFVPKHQFRQLGQLKLF